MPIKLVPNTTSYCATKVDPFQVKQINFAANETTGRQGRGYNIPIHIALAHEIGHAKTLTKKLIKSYNQGDHIPAEILAWGYALSRIHPDNWPNLSLIKACLDDHAHAESAWYGDKISKENRRIIKSFIAKLKVIKGGLTT